MNDTDIQQRWTLEQCLDHLRIDIHPEDLSKLRDEWYSCLEENVGEYVSVKRNMTIANGKVIQKTQAVVKKDDAIAQTKIAVQRWIKSEWRKAESRRQEIVDETTMRLKYLECLDASLSGV